LGEKLRGGGGGGICTYMMDAFCVALIITAVRSSTVLLVSCCFYEYVGAFALPDIGDAEDGIFD
jgi:hypothetical protein